MTITLKEAMAWAIKGERFQALQKNEAALKCFNEALKINPNICSVWISKGKVLLDDKKCNQALKCFDKAIQLNPDKFGDAWNGMGMALSELKNYVEANKCFKKALAIDDENPEYFFNRGSALAELGKFKKANDYLERAKKKL